MEIDLLIRNVRVQDDKPLMDIGIKDGKIVYDLNGISADLWTAPPGPHAAEAYRWTTFAPHSPAAQH